MVAMLMYAGSIMSKTANSALWPVLLHVISVFITVGLKHYFDLKSDAVGMNESMYVIIRSRFWLFPGILDKSRADAQKRIINKSAIEIEQDEANDAFDEHSEYDTMRIFPLKDYVTRATFERDIPENRILQRNLQRHHWSYVFDYDNFMGSKSEEEQKQEHNDADKVIKLARKHVLMVFPLLALLDVACCLPKLMNVLRLMKILKHMITSLATRETAVRNMDQYPEKGLIATRTEEYERDDLKGSLHPKTNAKRIQGMSEPMPWATLVLPKPSDKFEDIKSVVNTAGIVVFFVVLFAFYIMVTGKLVAHPVDLE